mmetsp:Transcript_10660/g.20983  ORF Transcript_10660/g.20983 Transcript_10660/m.20983 type:complete len:235 (-) Transcript_10660:598-1302(-)
MELFSTSKLRTICEHKRVISRCNWLLEIFVQRPVLLAYRDLCLEELSATLRVFRDGYLARRIHNNTKGKCVKDLDVFTSLGIVTLLVVVMGTEGSLVVQNGPQRAFNLVECDPTFMIIILHVVALPIRRGQDVDNDLTGFTAFGIDRVDNTAHSAFSGAVFNCELAAKVSEGITKETVDTGCVKSDIVQTSVGIPRQRFLACGLTENKSGVSTHQILGNCTSVGFDVHKTVQGL